MYSNTKKIINFKNGINIDSLPQNIEDNDLVYAYNILPDKSSIRYRFGTELINNELLSGKILNIFEYEDKIFIHAQRGDTYNYILMYNESNSTFTTMYQFERTNDLGVFIIFNSKLLFKNDKIYISLAYNTTTSTYDIVNIYTNVRVPVISNRIVSNTTGIVSMLEFEYLNSLTNRYKARYDVNRENSTDVIKLALIYGYQKYATVEGFNPKSYLTVRVINLQSGTYVAMADTDYTVENSYIYDNITKTYKYITFVNITNTGIANGYDVIEVEAYTQIDEYELQKDKNLIINNCDLSIVYNNQLMFASSYDTKNIGYFYMSEPLQENYFPQNTEFNRIVGGASSNIQGFSSMDNDLLIFTKYEIHYMEKFVNNDGTTYYKISLMSNEIGLSNKYSLKQYNNNTLFIFDDELYMTLRYNTTGQKSAAKIDKKIRGMIKSKIDETSSAYLIDNKYYLILNSAGDILVINLDNLAYIYKENMYYAYKQISFWFLNVPNASALLYKDDIIYLGLNTSSSLIKSNETLYDYNTNKFYYEYLIKNFDFGNNSKYKFIESIDLTVPADITISNDLEINYITEHGTTTETFIHNLLDNIQNFERNLRVRTNLRNTRYFSIKFKNIIVDELYINYNITKNNR